MSTTRREFLVSSAAIAGGITLLPYASMADSHFSNILNTKAGEITVHPVKHASFVMETSVGTIYSDPVGEAASYSEFPKPNLILITHEHGDHFNVDTLNAIVGENTKIITNPAVMEKLPENLKSMASMIANGEKTTYGLLDIDAIPAYNTTEDRLKFHPKGRDNGYVLNFGEFTVYISGDTEDIPEMRALKNIDLAFVCMNLPFTMDIKAAASAVAEFKPKVVYPYHYNGKDGGTQDPKEFAKLIGDAADVKLVNWYA